MRMFLFLREGNDAFFASPPVSQRWQGCRSDLEFLGGLGLGWNSAVVCKINISAAGNGVW